MRHLLAAVLLAGVIIYILRNEKAPTIKVRRENFEPELIQNTINKIQETERNVYPVDTIYFNRNEETDTYEGRFMFLNTEGFYGTQYDVVTDGSKIISLSKSIPPEFKNPFSGFVVKQSFKDMKSTAPVVDTKKIHENFVAGRGYAREM